MTFFAITACVTTFLLFQTHGWILGRSTVLAACHISDYSMATLTHFLFFLTHGWILGTIYSSLCYFMVFRHSLQTSLVDHAWRTGVPPVCYSYILPLSSSPCHCASEQVSPLSAYLYILPLSSSPCQFAGEQVSPLCIAIYITLQSYSSSHHMYLSTTL